MVQRPLLRLGSTGAAVTLLQQALNQGTTSLPALSEDGIFGPKTQRRVVEHQRQHGLVQDAIVGEQTHGSLENLYQVVANLIKLVPPPPGVEAARAAIKSIARAAANSLGWPDHEPQLPNPASGRIVTRRWFGPPDASGAKQRYGGFALATILRIASDNQANIAQKVTKQAQEMYEAHGYNPPKSDQNKNDLHDWCARFCVYVYRTAGLKIGSINGLPDVYKDFVPVSRIKDMQPGDMGIVSPVGRYHHFLIMETDGITLRTIDGNAGKHYSIIQRTYTIADTSPDQKGFFRINTNQGVEPFSPVTPMYAKLLAKMSGG